MVTLKWIIRIIVLQVNFKSINFIICWCRYLKTYTILYYFVMLLIFQRKIYSTYSLYS